MTSRRIFAAYGALALLTAFYPALFGMLPVPASSALAVLPDGGRPPELNELGDVPTQFLPWSRAVADAYRGGRLPLRFAANGCGTPLWANPQAQAVTPTTLLYLLLPATWASAAAAAVKLFVAACGAWIFLRRRALSEIAAGWAGFAYAFSLHATCWMHFPHTWPIALLPWALTALDRVSRGERGGFVATLTAVFLLLLGGYPEGELYVAVTGAVFVALVVLSASIGAGERARRLGLAAAASLLALGLTAAYTLPAALAVARGERARQADRGALAVPAPPISAGDFLLPPVYWDISRFWFVPEAQGNPRDQDKFGQYSFAGRASGYAGILIVAFALATFFWGRAPRAVAAGRWALVLLGLYVLWYPPLSHFLQAAPGLRQVAVRLTTNRANSLAVLVLAMLAAFELDRVRAGGHTRATRAGLVAALAATLAVGLEFARTEGRPPLTAWRAGSFALPVLLLLTCFVILSRKPTVARDRALLLVLLLGTGIDLLRIGVRFNPGTRPADYYPVTPATRELQAASRGGRFAASDAAFTGVAYVYGLEDVRVHDPVALADYEDVLAVAAGYTGPGEYMPRVPRLDAPILDFLDTRARLSPGGSIAVRETPKAVFPERLVGARDPADLYARLARETDFLRNAVAIGADEIFSGAATLISFDKPRPEKLQIRARTDAPRVLVVPESNDGGWSAEGNGSTLPTFVANGAFLAIRVPAGDTTIACRYLPPGFRAGLGISAASAIVLLAAAVYARRRR